MFQCGFRCGQRRILCVLHGIVHLSCHIGFQRLQFFLRGSAFLQNPSAEVLHGVTILDPVLLLVLCAVAAGVVAGMTHMAVGLQLQNGGAFTGTGAGDGTGGGLVDSQNIVAVHHFAGDTVNRGAAGGHIMEVLAEYRLFSQT